MPNPSETPKSIKPVVPPPPRSWQRTAFFALNCVIGLLTTQSCWFAFAISRDVLTLSVAIVVTIYVACEVVGAFNHSLTLERALGFANLVFAVVITIIFAVSIAKPAEPNQLSYGPVYTLALVPFFAAFLAYLITCGLLRVKGTAKHKPAPQE